MRILLKSLLHLLIFFFLTLISQIGGIAYFLSLILEKTWRVSFKGKSLATFVLVYLTATLIIVPTLAPIWGRETVSFKHDIRPSNYMTILLNRDYVRPQLNTLLEHSALYLKNKNTGVKIRYLDANFPFWNGFPVIPHLSHNDGKKIDLSLIYTNEKGEISTKQKSISGYGVFEEPRKGEWNQNKNCKDKGHKQYDFNRYLTFGRINSGLRFSHKGNQYLLRALLSNKSLGKILIEPHLETRLGIADNRLRFHGCHAVRHDDHIHVQL